MSVSHPDSLRYLLDGEEPLDCSYDEQTDILYLWRGETPGEAVSLTSVEGHLARLDPGSGEIVGFTIFDFRRRWQNADETHIKVTVPRVGLDDRETTEARELELVPA